MELIYILAATASGSDDSAQQFINLDLASLNPTFSQTHVGFHSQLYDTCLSYCLWFQKLLDFKNSIPSTTNVLPTPSYHSHPPTLNSSIPCRLATVRFGPGSAVFG